MLYIFLVCALVLAAWFTVRKLARTGTARDMDRARRETREVIRASLGLEIDGDPIGAYTMRGEVHGIATSIDGRTKPSLASAVHHVTTITVPAELPDQIVCRRSEVDAIMGSLPSMPPRPTGDPRFDEPFAVFVGATSTDGYRDPTGASPPTWVDPTTLADMVAQRLVFLRVQSGSCELAFPQTLAREIGPLVTTAANVARRASGQPLAAAPTAETFVAPARSFDSVTSALNWASWSLLLSPMAFVIGFFPPLRELNSEMECGVGGQIRVSESNLDGEGTSYGLHCWNDNNVWGPPMVGHYASALAIYIALIFAAITVLALTRWPKKERAW